MLLNTKVPLLPDSALKKVASSSSSCDDDPPTSTVWSHSSGMESTLTGVSRPDRSRGGARRWHMACRPAETPPAAGTSSSSFFLASLQEVPSVRSGESSMSVSRSDSSLSSSRSLKNIEGEDKEIKYPKLIWSSEMYVRQLCVYLETKNVHFLMFIFPHFFYYSFIYFVLFLFFF